MYASTAFFFLSIFDSCLRIVEKKTNITSWPIEVVQKYKSETGKKEKYWR